MFTKIYVDLDGVLADFDGFYFQKFGYYPRNADVLEAEMWKNINEFDRFFFHLPLMKDAKKLWNYVNSIEGVKAKILTATGWRFEDVSGQKISWCEKNLSIPKEDIITVKRGPVKAEYADSKSILIDDTFTKCIEPWVNAGGLGIHHKDVDSTIEQIKCFL